MTISDSRSIREIRRGRTRLLRRNDVLVAAAQVFSEKGFQDSHVTEIATVAEVSLNSVYSLYSGKEELYGAVLQSAVATVRDRVLEEVDAISDPGEKLLCAIDALFSCLHEHRSLLRIFVRYPLELQWRIRQPADEELPAMFQSFRSWLVQLARDTIEDGRLDHLDPESVADALIGTVTTIVARGGENPREEEAIANDVRRTRALFEALVTGKHRYGS